MALTAAWAVRSSICTVVSCFSSTWAAQPRKSIHQGRPGARCAVQLRPSGTEGFVCLSSSIGVLHAQEHAQNPAHRGGGASTTNLLVVGFRDGRDQQLAVAGGPGPDTTMYR